MTTATPAVTDSNEPARVHLRRVAARIEGIRESLPIGSEERTELAIVLRDLARALGALS